MNHNPCIVYSGREGLDKIIAAAEGRVRVDVEHWHAAAPGDSPIEKMLICALYAQTAYRPYTDVAARILPCADGQNGPSGDLSRECLYFVPQVTVRGRRVDYMIWAHDGQAWRRLLVECDGHDFHERTKEQIAKDRAYDRDVQLSGDTIFRFPGSEIFRDPVGCAYAILRWADQITNCMGEAF